MDLNGAAVDENELPNANGADEPKVLAPNENDGLNKVSLFFSFLPAGLSSANAVDTTRSPRKAIWIIALEAIMLAASVLLLVSTPSHQIGTSG